MSQKRKRKQLKNIIDIADYYPKKIIHNTPKTENQKEYYNLIQSNHTDIILGVGPSGTGKTLLAVESAIQGYMDYRQHQNGLYVEILKTQQVGQSIIRICQVQHTHFF